MILATAVSAAALTVSACMGGEGAAGSSFVPAHPGVLTVATAFLPAPGFWQSHPPTSKGFEAGLANALAHHLGLDRVEVVQVPFAKIVGGHLGGADLALSQLTPTSKREQSLEPAVVRGVERRIFRHGFDGHVRTAIDELSDAVTKATLTGEPSLVIVDDPSFDIAPGRVPVLVVRGSPAEPDAMRLIYDDDATDGFAAEVERRLSRAEPKAIRIRRRPDADADRITPASRT